MDNEGAGVIRVLLEAGVDINARGNNGWTALHVAADNEEAEVVRALLEAGADMNAKGNNGRTALHVAADKGKVALQEFVWVRGL